MNMLKLVKDANACWFWEQELLYLTTYLLGGLFAIFAFPALSSKLERLFTGTYETGPFQTSKYNELESEAAVFSSSLQWFEIFKKIPPTAKLNQPLLFVVYSIITVPS